MHAFKFTGESAWIWSAQAAQPYNNIVLFKRTISVSGPLEEAGLHITADSRYALYVNEEWVGHGPPRSWHSPWPVDAYDLCSWLREGDNTITVRVQYYGIGTFQYLHAEPGLIAQLHWRDAQGDHAVGTDDKWSAAADTAFTWPVPRISCMQGWEEQYDARHAPTENAWKPAKVVRRAGEGSHYSFELLDIPMLTCDPVSPTKLLDAVVVKPAPYVWSINPRAAIHASDRSANMIVARMILVTWIDSPVDQEIEFHPPHDRPVPHWKLNGNSLQFDDHTLQLTGNGVARAKLIKGKNVLVGRMPECEHYWWSVIIAWTHAPVRFCLPRDDDAQAASPPWLLLGPFDIAQNGAEGESGVIPPFGTSITAERIDDAAAEKQFARIWSEGPSAEDLRASFARPADEHMVAPVDVFATCASERIQPGYQPRIENADALLNDSPENTVIYPNSAGDARILLDFGREVVGFHEIEIDAPSGTIVDNHNFEFIQPDGRINLCEGMCNSFRYTCVEGRQRYRTWTRRGFRYSWFTFRHFDRPIRLRQVRLLMSTFPVAERGDFTCSDETLTRIWHVGAHSVRCCAEDTYTDCPTYEQAFWVGDARNESMVDLVVSGDDRLSRHSWIQAGRSLDRSPLVEAIVPSAWQTILPAWSFLWMRWAQEHFMATGDVAFGQLALGFLDKNIAGIERHVNREGLFEIKAWNMFDWAPMDTPCEGVVTHQNCLAVLGLQQVAELADQLGDESRCRRWNALAESMAAAINANLWSDENRAYLDCIRPDGKPSRIFSQQTQTAALIADVARGERGARCRQIIDHPPAGFVTAGSPFFMFFLLEVLAREGDCTRLLQTIRNYWGKQIDAGATTFWEMYHEGSARMTRSHCHGWSAAPTVFLTRHALGVRPLDPGYSKVLINPGVTDLRWARGRVPTPRGIIQLSWQRQGNQLDITLELPPGVTAVVKTPPGSVKLNGNTMLSLADDQLA